MLSYVFYIFVYLHVDYRTICSGYTYTIMETNYTHSVHRSILSSLLLDTVWLKKWRKDTSSIVIGWLLFFFDIQVKNQKHMQLKRGK